MIEADALFLFWLGLGPILLMTAVLRSSRAPKPAPPASAPFLPSAEETAETVRRFHEAVERSMLIDFIWDRYSKGRALFLDDMRRAAGRGKKRANMKSKADIPRWV